MKSIARVLRLPRAEDAENGYNAMVAAYNIDLSLKPEGVKKIYSILARTNPKASVIQTGNHHRRFADPKDSSKRLLKSGAQFQKHSGMTDFLED